MSKLWFEPYTTMPGLTLRGLTSHTVSAGFVIRGQYWIWWMSWKGSIAIMIDERRRSARLGWLEVALAITQSSSLPVLPIFFVRATPQGVWRREALPGGTNGIWIEIEGEEGEILAVVGQG